MRAQWFGHYYEKGCQSMMFFETLAPAVHTVAAKMKLLPPARTS